MKQTHNLFRFAHFEIFSALELIPHRTFADVSDIGKLFGVNLLLEHFKFQVRIHWTFLLPWWYNKIPMYDLPPEMEVML